MSVNENEIAECIKRLIRQRDACLKRLEFHQKYLLEFDEVVDSIEDIRIRINFIDEIHQEFTRINNEIEGGIDITDDETFTVHTSAYDQFTTEFCKTKGSFQKKLIELTPVISERLPDDNDASRGE
jgi:hypothetical protein